MLYMKKVMIGAVATIMITSPLIPIHVFNPTIVYAAVNTDETAPSFSDSLRKLGESTAEKMRMQMSIRKQNTTFQFKEASVLGVETTNLQRLNKKMADSIKNMKEWDSELYPELLQFNQKNKSFLNAFQIYFPSLEKFVQQDTHTEEEEEAFLARLTDLENKANQQIILIQRYEQKQNVLQDAVEQNVEEWTTAQDKAETQVEKATDTLRERLEKSQTNVEDMKKRIGELPGEFQEVGFDLALNVGKMVKEVLNSTTEDALAKRSAAKTAIDDAVRAAKAKAKEEGMDIKEAEKKAKEELKKTSTDPDIQAALHGNDGPIVDVSKVKVDMDEIEKIVKDIAKAEKLSAEHAQALQTLQEEFQKQYDLTTALQFNISEQRKLESIKGELTDFSYEFKAEAKLLKGYIQDWENIKTFFATIKETQDTSTTDQRTLKKQIKSLRDLRKSLENQYTKFNKVVSDKD